ncbi:hypothetical protein BDV19DRAFT_336776 [Aspergillus venezuelensis]
MPLLITQSAMQTLLDWYYIGEEFLDLVHSFGRKPHISDAGHGRMTVHRRRSGAYGAVCRMQDVRCKEIG